MSNVGQTIPFTLHIAKSKLYMVQLRLTILFLFIAIISYAQEDVIEFEKITFKGLRLISTKAKIIESFGEPRIVDTNYECGAFANDQPGGPYYLLSYNGFNYIGSDKDTFTLHSIVFDQEGILKLYLDGRELSGISTEDDFSKLFGGEVKDRFVKHSDHNTLLLYSKDSDDGAIFTFKSGKLHKFEYWTPC